MKLSIVQRTVSGFALMFLFTVFLSGVSLYSAQILGDKVELISQESTPMLVTSSELTTTLGQVNLLVRDAADENDEQEIASEFNQYKRAYFDLLRAAEKSTEHLSKASLVSDIQYSSNGYFDEAEQLIELQQQINVLQLIRESINHDFLRLEDTYQWAADLLLSKAAVKRSLHNRAELITSGISRDLKLLRRANRNTDLPQLRKVMANDIEIAFKRLEGIAVDEDVRNRYALNLNKMKKLVLEQDGLISVLSKQQQLEQAFIQQKQKTDTQLIKTETLLEEYVQGAEQVVQRSVIEAEGALKQAFLSVIFMTSIAALFSIFIGVNITRSIQKPLNIINNVLNKMTNGDMRVRTQYKANDEFGELSHLIDILASSMS
ncbi:MAG: methyl-accepting chemotaxis protein, partial [Aliivibrio sp.]|nr:methyl-accepting chemotaxis protein [Aliivibrio sp.]